MKAGPKWLLPVVIGGVVVALASIALLREQVLLDPTTPEGTVQEYLQAISDEDFDRAFETLDPESFEGCTPSDIQRSGWDENFTASLPETSEPPVGERIFVDVTMHFGGGGPFNGGWDSFETFVLVSNDGFWWITEDPWPYFRWNCAGGDF